MPERSPITHRGVNPAAFAASPSNSNSSKSSIKHSAALGPSEARAAFIRGHVKLNVVNRRHYRFLYASVELAQAPAALF